MLWKWRERDVWRQAGLRVGLDSSPYHCLLSYRGRYDVLCYFPVVPCLGCGPSRFPRASVQHGSSKSRWTYVLYRVRVTMEPIHTVSCCGLTSPDTLCRVYKVPRTIVSELQNYRITPTRRRDERMTWTIYPFWFMCSIDRYRLKSSLP